MGIQAWGCSSSASTSPIGLQLKTSVVLVASYSIFEFRPDRVRSGGPVGLLGFRDALEILPSRLDRKLCPRDPFPQRRRPWEGVSTRFEVDRTWRVTWD